MKYLPPNSSGGGIIHRNINWFAYSVILLFSLSTWLFQGNSIAGPVGVALAMFNLVYNFLIGYFINDYKRIHYIGYVTITLNIISLTVYNCLDAMNNSLFLPATSATLLLFPVIIFLASLRINHKLVIFSTVLSVASMDGLYLYVAHFHDLDIHTSALSTDWLSRGYRTIYLIMIGYMISRIPKTMYRILGKQEVLRQETLVHQTKAEKDPLTTLHNRHYLNSYFENYRQASCLQNQKFALLYIDINDFKQINDTYGHDYGDFVLISLGKDLRSAVRDEDIVARLGGMNL